MSIYIIFSNFNMYVIIIIINSNETLFRLYVIFLSLRRIKVTTLKYEYLRLLIPI